MVKITMFKINLRPGRLVSANAYAIRLVTSSFKSVPSTVMYVVLIRLRGNVCVEKMYRYPSSVNSSIQKPPFCENEETNTYQKGTTHRNVNIATTP